ncbi:hypothetical protein VTH06DRAFT_4444 [Thermothelomyces fergusii]
MHRRHQHPPSYAGPPARPSTDSTSSRRTDVSIDWDPLRLHPSLTPGPSPPLRDAFSESTSRPYMPHELRQARSSRAVHQSPPSPLHGRNPSSETVIYDGFDFGFDNTASNRSPSSSSSNRNDNSHPASALARFTNATAPHSGSRQVPSPTPSDASSECSLTFSGSSTADDSSPEEEMWPGCGLGLTPAPAPRPRPKAAGLRRRA